MYILHYLIKSQQYHPMYHHWFEKGIELELRITSLYEAYLLSMDERKVDQVPKIIQMYFQYECSLPYKKMARNTPAWMWTMANASPKPIT